MDSVSGFKKMRRKDKVQKRQKKLTAANEINEEESTNKITREKDSLKFSLFSNDV